MSRKNDHHHHHHDHRRTFDTITGGGHYGGGGGGGGRMFCISVVGLSGTEKEKGCLGVGKSCLCNRFIRPQADEYNRDHISILSQPDFSGPIVNNEHWLYWGETRKCTDEGFELTFSIVEQTEFVDDACFQPFRSGKTMEPYHKRCAATRLNSAEKLMYICKNQLGIEKEYEQHYLLDGKFNVDGFICVFDVSQIQGRSIERQIELTALILNSLLKTKKPVVLATTKNDEYSERYVREAEKLVNRREFKGLIPLVETSAHDNVNIDLAFWACVQRDWTKGKTKILSYHEAFQRQQDKLVIVNDAYLTLIKSNITDYRSHWNNTYSNLSQSQDFITYCDLFGQESAQQTFKRHVKKLKDEYVCRKIDMYLRRLPKIFSEMLPDLESFGHDRSWPSVQQILHQHPLFDSNFVLNESLSWQEMDDTNETRIPFDLLQTPEAEKSYLDHLKTLMAEDHLRSLRYQFSELLRETSVVPGQPLREIRDQLKGRECVESLPESELKLIYDEYQKILQQDARDQLNELFLERASLFLQFSTGKTLTQEDLAAISHELSKDDRWLTLDLIPQDRQLALIRHLGFLQWPIKEHCSAGQTCVDLNIEAYHASLAKRNTRNPLWNHDLEKIQIKFIVLGLSAYADNLATVVKAMCPSLEQENPRIHYEMETLPSNESLGMFPIRPFANPLQSEAYLCVYSSRTSLEYLLKTLEHSLLADLQYGSLHPNGLPLVLLLACTPDTSAKERNYLREEGTNRAQCLQCAFFDVTSNEPHARFKSDELLRALIFLSESLIRRAEMSHVFGGPNNSLATNHSIPEGALNPEIRILISLMCGDPLSPARFLESLILMDSLTNLNFYPVSDHSFVTDIGFLLSIDDENNDSLSLNNSQQQQQHEITSCYVEFVVTSYHSSYTIKEELFYGNILVYWSKRQASFANMSALASITASLMPIHILALVENELRPSKLSHQLVAKGKELADQLQAHFRISTLGSEMGKCISSFLNYCLQNKHLIEKNLQIATASSNVVGIENQFDPQAIDDCFIGTDPNDANFESILQQQAHINDHCESPSKLLSDSIYEKLPEDQQQLSKIHQQSSSSNKQHSNEFPSSFLVGHRVGQTHKRYSPEDILDSSSSAAAAVSDMRNAQHFFNPIFNSNEPRTAASTTGEHLLKPSEMIRQRKQQQQHLNNNNHNYYNLQSYPSADSLDRLYALDSHFHSNYYDDSNIHHHHHVGNGNDDDIMTQCTTQLPAHFVYRPSVQRSHMIASEGHSNFIDSSIDQLPPRPASSAHVMIPTNSSNDQYHHNPPPYSRVAISPPPAYRMHSNQQQNYQLEMNPDSDHQLYSNYYHNHHQHHNEQEPSLEPNTLAYYQRKYYPILSQQQQQLHHELYSTFQNHHQPSSSLLSSSFGTNFNNKHSIAAHSIISNVHSRNSPLIYATTGHHFHPSQQQIFRSPHFHSNNHQKNILRNRSAFQSTTSSELSPYMEEERISLHSKSQNKKKKKKHSFKTRSSSLSHKMAIANEQDEEDDDDNDNNDYDGNNNDNGHHQSSKFIFDNSKDKSRSILNRSKNRNRKNDEQSLNRVSKFQDIDPKSNHKNDKNIKSKSSENINSFDDHTKNDNYESETNKNAANVSNSNNNDDDDEDDIVVDEDEESCVSSDTSADENLNATADKYAVISGWAYHQKQNNSRSPTTVLGSNHNRLPDQWPPTTTSSSLAAAAAAIIQPPIINDENTSSNERSKAPGKIDIKKYNNLSNAIGRLNLHSPLGPTRSTHSTFDDISKSAIFDDSKIHLNKRERIPIKHSSSTKDNDSESEVSDSTNILTNNDQQTSEISILNERIKFNSLKQPSTIGQLRQNSSNNSKNTQNKKSRRITPVPVAPPRLPSSANSSNAVTPTSSGVGKSFTSFSSYDDSINDKSLNTTTVNSSINNQDIFDTNGNDNENKTGMDSGELRRTRWHQFSKLFSLPADNESGISIDDNSIDAASEDTSVSHSINPTAAAAIAASKASGNNNNSNGEKAKFLKSKSIGTFPELDKKSMRKAEKMEKKRMKEEERKQRKSSKENSSRNRSRSKGTHSSLEDFAQPNGNPVPLFIEKCTLFIEQEGLDMEGIYRVPGNRAHVDTLLLKFDENPDINIAELDIPVNAVATALKDFFLKRLPPIFPSDSMTNIANLAKQYTDAGQLSEMRTFIRELPNSNFEILKHMISHFVKITEKSSENSMDSKNLAICWWPTLLQFEFTNMDLFEQKRPHLMNFVQIMIDSYSDLFSINADSEDNLATLSCSADELSSL
ncbi:rho GTPase-activating protein 190 isoform X2 [Dermatophagoides pteronyssinus]|uniref:rho GTPase-activating protein 190 isoform X2 n=1 Tax=Dermatophagoides pteronyssinus TaxID=6956 RepID=UPI003F670DFE